MIAGIAKLRLQRESERAQARRTRCGVPVELGVEV
jgi:hypothetical protein